MMKKIENRIMLVIVIIAVIIMYGLYHFCYDMNSLLKGEFLESIESPTGKYTINSYLSKNSLSADAIRVELINNKTSKRKNIYWGYNESLAYMEWIDENTVEINEHVLNIHKDIYDWRRNN